MRTRFAALLTSTLVLASGASCEQEPPGWQLFASGHGTPIALSADGARAYAVRTTEGKLAVLDVATRTFVGEIHVGIDPVSVAVRPDGSEVWVANHVSDSISVIDADPASPTFHNVIDTIQEIDADGVTRFDEPVGIAFASEAKAYVTLSSTNRVAIIDVATRSVTGHLAITAQDPRAIAVQDGFVYVAAFESGNRSQTASCDPGETFPDCSGPAAIGTRVIISDEGTEHIVHEPALPDRDLFVFDAATDQLVSTVEGVGTLLYGMAVGAGGDVWIAHTDARNLANGEDGDVLASLENRMFDNRVGHVACPAGSCGAATAIALDPALPAQPAPGEALATPFGIAVAPGGAMLVATAAGSSRVFTLDAASGAVLDRLDVGAIPRGVVLGPGTGGAFQDAWVHNSLDDSVSLVHVQADGSLAEAARIEIGSSRIPASVREGRIAFNDAHASTSGTFSCASCHPDGNTDQLTWRIGLPCTTCSGEEIRNTQPIRGLRDTLPLHWDGTLGDPFAGRNGTGATVPASCDPEDPNTCFRHLVDAALGSVMCDVSAGCPSGGALDPAERNVLAHFLPSVSHPPARERPIDDAMTQLARNGLFEMSFGGVPAFGTCGNTLTGCHALPLSSGTADSIAGFFDAASLRGMNDRFILFSNGGAGNLQKLLDVGYDPAPTGMDEMESFRSAFPGVLAIYETPEDMLFQMVQEASVGHSAAFARQLTLNATTAGTSETDTLFDALELAATREVVVLEARGLRDTGGGFAPIALRRVSGGLYAPLHGPGAPLSRAELLAEAASGDLLLTLTASLDRPTGGGVFLQPLIMTHNLESLGFGADPPPLRVIANNIRADSRILVNGEVVAGTVDCRNGAFTPFCETEEIDVDLDERPANGCHILQVQTPGGLLSNELFFCE